MKQAWHDWKRTPAGMVVASVDLWAGVAVALFAGVFSWTRPDNAASVVRPLLLTTAAVSVGLLGVVATVTSFVSAVLDTAAYRRILERAGLEKLARLPYRSALVVSGVAALASLLGALVGSEFGRVGLVAGLSAGLGLTAWAVVGVIQVGLITISHGQGKAAVQATVEEFQRRQRDAG